MSSLVLLLIAVVCLVQESAAWRDSRSIIDKHTSVTAVIAAINGTDRKGYALDAAEAAGACKLTFTFGGHDYAVMGSIGDQTDNGLAIVGHNVTLHIDPDSPDQRWTAAGSSSLGVQLVGFWVTLPVVLALFGVAFWQRTRYLNLWVDGRDEQCVVVDTSQSALAPLSLAVRCTPVVGYEHRVATVFVPRRVADPRPGDEIWVIFARNQFAFAIAAAAFDPPGQSPAGPPASVPPAPPSPERTS